MRDALRRGSAMDKVWCVVYNGNVANVIGAGHFHSSNQILGMVRRLKAFDLRWPGIKMQSREGRV